MKVFTGFFLALFFTFLDAKVYATVDGEEITDKDLLFLKQIMPNVDFDNLPKDMKNKALDQAIERKLLTREAKKENFENTTAYKEALEDFKETMILELWMRKQIDGVKVNDDEIKKFYDANKDKFVIPESVSARHILVTTEKEAQDIIKELNKVTASKAEEKFIELAKSKSKDPSANNGGDLGTFTKDQMVAPFSNAAFSLKDKTYTKQPVKTEYGYHVIYVTSKVPEGTLAYNEAKPKIEQELRLNKFRDVISSKARNLRDSSKIVIK